MGATLEKSICFELPVWLVVVPQCITTQILPSSVFLSEKSHIPQWTCCAHYPGSWMSSSRWPMTVDIRSYQVICSRKQIVILNHTMQETLMHQATKNPPGHSQIRTEVINTRTCDGPHPTFVKALWLGLFSRPPDRLIISYEDPGGYNSPTFRSPTQWNNDKNICSLI